MSDGKQTVGRDAFEVAGEAKEVGVPITTISFGTESGTVEIEGQTQPVPVDNAAMQEVADILGGEFGEAGSAGKLHSVYDNLDEQIGYEIVPGDVSKPWFVLATLFASATGLVFTRRLL